MTERTDAQGTRPRGKRPLGFAQRLRKLLVGAPEDEAKARAQDAFGKSLDDVIREHGSAAVAELQMLNLAELLHRWHAGDDAMLATVERRIKRVIEASLSEGECYIRHDVGIYALLFPALVRDAAELRAAVIAGQVLRALKAQDAAFDELEISSTAEMVADMGQPAHEGAEPYASVVIRADSDLKHYRELQRQQERATRAFADAAERREGSAWRPAVANAADSPSPGGSQDDLYYRPLWNVRSGVLSAYRATSRCGTGEPADEGGFRKAAAALDSAVQRQALKDLATIFAAGGNILVVAPVHFTTVDRHDLFVPYLAELMSLDEKLRKLVIYELIDTPPDLPAFRIDETVTRLRHRVRSVLARVPPDASSLSAWANSGVHAVGFDRDDLQATEKTLFAMMDHFSSSAEANRLAAYICGLDTLSMVTNAVCSGFAYIEGQAVRPAVPALSPLESFGSGDLLSQIF